MPKNIGNDKFKDYKRCGTKEWNCEETLQTKSTMRGGKELKKNLSAPTFSLC